MSLSRDWEETGGKPQASPEQPGGVSGDSAGRSVAGTSVPLHRGAGIDPIARRRLLELIGAVLVIFAVMYVMIPVFLGTAESSRRSVCANHLQRLVRAVKMYEIDNEGLPPTGTWTYAIYPNIIGPDERGTEEAASGSPLARRRPPTGVGSEQGLETLFCPSEANLPQLRRQRVAYPSSYSYANPYERHFTGDEAATPLLWDRMGGIGRAAHPGGGNVAYLDGHASWLPAQRWTAGDFP
jgi:prepilin-type processing-associated H-X9-DG protein